MELRQLRYFIGISEAGSLLKASARLHVAQPALGQQISALEDDVGAKLFERSSRGVVLTEAGKSFLEHARVVLADDTQRLTVPIAAISRNAGQEQVWMIEKGALVRRIVTTGRSDAREGRVEILNGLQPQAQVLAARFDNLREGDPASVVAA